MQTVQPNQLTNRGNHAKHAMQPNQPTNREPTSRYTNNQTEIKATACWKPCNPYLLGTAGQTNQTNQTNQTA
jgi:hypothetical protein